MNDRREPFSDEESLRRLLQDTVDGLEPGPRSLERLRTAVPARRRRRRRALVAATASVALLGVAAPLAATVADAGGTTGRTSVEAGGERAAGGPGHDDAPGGSGTGGPDGPTDGPGRPEADDERAGEDPAAGGDAGATGPGDDGADLEVTSPTCSRDQLGAATAAVLGTPDAEGRVYGQITMTNVSGDSCRVSGTGELAVVQAGGGTEPGVQVVERTEGDRAVGLPAPDRSYDELLLPPGASFEIRFAWVPAAPAAGQCAVDAAETDTGLSTALTRGAPLEDAGTGAAPADTTGGTGTGEEDPPDDTTGGTGSGEEEPPDETTGGTGSGDGEENPPDDTTGGTGGGEEEPVEPGDPPAEIVLRYTPEAGEPAAARVTLSGSAAACTGTVYRTDVLPE
jgi:hypothetical protein